MSKTYLIIFLALSEAICFSGPVVAAVLDSSAFGDVPATSLCFDLRSDGQIVAGLITRVDVTSQKGDLTYVIPFSTSEPKLPEDVLARWGAYELFSIISVTVDPAKPGLHVVSFKPSVSEIQDVSPVFSELRSSLYYIHNGLERQFTFKYPEIGKTGALWNQLTSKTNAAEIRYIGVVIPEKAKGSEIAFSGKTAIPEHQATSGKAKLYPASTMYAGQQEALRISFLLPASAGQKIFFEYSTRFGIGIIAPIIALILLRPAGIQQRRQRKVALIALLSLQTVIVISLIALAVAYWNEDRTRATLDFVVALLGAFLAGYAAWEKDRSDRAMGETGTA